MDRPVQPTEPSPRIESVPVETMRQEWLDILARIPGEGLKGAGFPRNVLGVLMQSPDTFGEYMEWWVTCKEKMSLTVREQELVILRMAVLFASQYVWKHHVPVGREFGITDPELVAVREGTYGGFIPREAALLALTDEFVEARTARREAWDTHASVLAPVDVVDLIQLVSQYVLFALANNVGQVVVEAALDDVPGLEDPISGA